MSPTMNPSNRFQTKIVQLANNVNNATIGITKAATDIVKSGVPAENGVAISTAAKEMVTANGELVSFMKEFSENLAKGRFSKKSMQDVTRLAKKLGVAVSSVIPPAVIAAGTLAQKDKLITEVQTQAKLMATAITEMVQGSNDIPVHLGRAELICLAGKVIDTCNNILSTNGPGSMALVKTVHQSVDAATTLMRIHATSVTDNSLQNMCISSAKSLVESFERLSSAVEASIKTNAEAERAKIDAASKELNSSFANLIRQRSVIDFITDARDLLKTTSDLMEITKFVTLTSVDFDVQRSIIKTYKPVAVALIQLGDAVSNPARVGFIPNLIEKSEIVCNLVETSKDSLKAVADGWVLAPAQKTQVKDALEVYTFMSKCLLDSASYAKETKQQ